MSTAQRPDITSVEFRIDRTVITTYSDAVTKQTELPIEIVDLYNARIFATQHFLKRKRRLCPTPRI